MELEHLKKCLLCGSEDIPALDKDNNICRCDACGYMFDNPRPSKKDIGIFYSQNDKYDMWLGEEGSRDRLWKRRLKLIRKYRQSGCLLDAGTGIGQFLYFAKEYFTVSGTEVSESAVKIAKEKYGLSIFKGELEDIRFDPIYDMVTLFHVLEHVHDPLSTIKRCHELLKPGGILIIAVPNDVSGIQIWIKKIFSIAGIGKFRKFGRFGLTKLALDGSLNEIHLSHFSPSVLIKFLERSGFDVTSSTLDPYFSADGFKLVFHKMVYMTCLLLKKVFNADIYPTSLTVARKKTMNI